jgi:cell division transport system permease protein
MNVNHVTKKLESEVEINVYLADANSLAKNTIIKHQILALSHVKSIDYISKKEAIELMKQKLGKENAEIVQGYEGDDNPLPNKFIVKPTDAKYTANLASHIIALNEGETSKIIDSVEYGRDAVERLLAITNVIRNIGFVLVLGMTITAMFLISNTIKLTIINRKREIAIMKLVGATNGFIRFPFFVEGILLGLIGSAIPILGLLYGYSTLVSKTKEELHSMLITLLPLNQVMQLTAGVLLVLGVVLGIWGTTVSVRKFLKV